MPRLGSKKSRTGCIQCKARRVKVCFSYVFLACILTLYSVMKTVPVEPVRGIASNAVSLIMLRLAYHLGLPRKNRPLQLQ